MPRTPAPPRLEPLEGVYHVWWRDQSAKREKRRSLGTRDPVEAAARFAAFIAQLTGGEVGPSPKVRDVLEHYRDKHVKVKCADKDAICHIIKRVSDQLGEIRIDNVTPDVCADYTAKRLAAGVGTGSPRNELLVIRAAARQALRWKLITPAQMPVIDLPPAPPGRNRWLTVDEMAHARRVFQSVWSPGLRRWVKPMSNEPISRAFLFLEVAYYTAGRHEAVIELEWDRQVDLAAGLIHLNPLGRRQTAKRRSVVPIHSRLRPTLERAYRTRQSRYLFDGIKTIRQVWNTARAKAGFGDDVTPHVMRHTRATHLAMRGVELADIAALLGDTVATVEKTYKHISPAYLRKLEAAE